MGDNDVKENLYNLGILGPIRIIEGGRGYQANDTILFSGGRGQGANAIVATVNATGAITSTRYVTSPGYKPGGMGYTKEGVPQATVLSANNQATGASLSVVGILGDGAKFSATVSTVGSISTINILDPGEDYISAPTISLKVQDILVSNTSLNNLPAKNDIVYQGETLESSSYRANVDSLVLVIPDFVQENSTYRLRVFDYNTETLNPNLPLKINGKDSLLQRMGWG